MLTIALLVATGVTVLVIGEHLRVVAHDAGGLLPRQPVRRGLGRRQACTPESPRTPYGDSGAATVEARIVKDVRVEGSDRNFP